MKILSVNVASPREYEYRGKHIRTAIFKRPVAGPVEVRHTRLAGDRQADSAVHGGAHKAVYAYAHDHHDWWCRTLGIDELEPGHFGENLTLTGLLESEARIGDRVIAGSAVLEISGPRLPCYKLGLRFDDPQMPLKFKDSGRCGFYSRVLASGTVRAGDPIEHGAADRESVTVAELFRALTGPRTADAVEVLRRARVVGALDPALLPTIEKRLRGHGE